MMRKWLPDLIFICAITVLIEGCTVPLSKQVREQAAKDLSFAEVISDPSAYQGKTVIWGGFVSRMAAHDDLTDIYIREAPLDFRGKPRDSQSSGGLFIARTPKRPDPEKFKAGNSITLAGEITGEKLGTYEGEPYVYPVLDMIEFYLWEKGFPKVRWEKRGGKFPLERGGIYSPEDNYFFPAR
jgi:outer membrane lipoprotein